MTEERRPEAEEGLVKVTFDLPDMDATESLWAEPLGNCVYRLRNVPFFVRGYSEQDTVRAEEDEGRLTVRCIVGRSGHSTYRVYLPEDTTEDQFSQDWTPLGD